MSSLFHVSQTPTLKHARGPRRFLKRELVALGDAPIRTGAASPTSTSSGSTGPQQQSPATSHSHRVAFSRVVIRAAPALDAPVVGVAHQDQTLQAVGERVQAHPHSPPRAVSFSGAAVAHARVRLDVCVCAFRTAGSASATTSGCY